MISRGYVWERCGIAHNVYYVKFVGGAPDRSGTWGVLDSGINLADYVPGGRTFLAVLYVGGLLLCCPNYDYSICSFGVVVNRKVFSKKLQIGVDN
jgi:hypothetical protein